MENVYDQVKYSHLPSVETQPDRLAVLARLRGIDAPPVETARVLDLGANEGGNLIPMAVALPQAQFTGIELAAGPVDRGNRLIRELGVSNARLLQMNLLDVNSSFGEFDYIVAHGLYSWTPAPIRDHVLAIARANLSPNGVAFISYNTYPGGHIRKLLREMMLFHARDAADPEAVIAKAREILRVAVAAGSGSDELGKGLALEAERILKGDDATLCHDYMAESYEPVYFREFVAHAASHGLAYVDDASVTDTWNTGLPESVEEDVRGLAAGDPHMWEQYLDLLRVRPFRRSLLTHAETPIGDGWAIDRANGMFAATHLREGDSSTPGAIEFRSSSGAALVTRHPGVIEFLRRASAVWPAAVPITTEHAEMALMLFRRGFIDVRSIPGAAVRAGKNPLASPLARHQVRQGPSVATLLHSGVTVSNESARRFLLLLDGTRDWQCLAREMGCTVEQVESELDTVARLGLLLA